MQAMDSSSKLSSLHKLFMTRHFKSLFHPIASALLPVLLGCMAPLRAQDAERFEMSRRKPYLEDSNGVRVGEGPERLARLDLTRARVVAGEAKASTSGHVLEVVTATDQTVLEWNSFSISGEETIRFIQPNPSSSVIIRVTGEHPAEIGGRLLSNGKVALIASGGIDFAATSEVHCAALVASSHDIRQGDLSTSEFLCFKGRSDAKVSNAGRLAASTGSIFLIGKSVGNRGVIDAGNGHVALLAGSEVSLAKSLDGKMTPRVGGAGEQGIVKHSGLIKAGHHKVRSMNGQGGPMVVVAGSVSPLSTGEHENSQVLIHAGGLAEVAGVVFSGSQADGGDISVSATEVVLTTDARLNADGDYQGGNIRVGGGYQGKDESIANALATQVQAGTLISANSRLHGDGGTVIVWSDGATVYRGMISATGGAQYGNGGLAEVSGKGWLGFEGQVDLSADNGDEGTLLLDPSTITIQAANPDLNGDGTTGDDIVGDMAMGDFAGANSIITTGQLETLLDGADVNLAATELIQVNSSLSWNSASGLTLTAGSEVRLNAAITNSGLGGVLFNAPSITLGASVSTAGWQTYNGAVRLTGDSILTGRGLTLASGLTGGSNDLTLDFSTPFTLAGGISGVNNFTAQQTVNVSGAFTTTGSQTYNGAVMLTGDSTLTGTSLTLASGLTGGSNDLTLDFSTPFTLAGGISGLKNFTAQKTVNVQGAFTTTGSQTYNGVVRLTRDSTLTGTSLTLASGLTGGGNDLTLDFSTPFTLAGGISGVKNFSAEKAVNVNGAFTTTGSQTYNGAVTLTGTSTLVGTTITNNSTMAGASNGLTITGNAAVNGAITGLTNFSVSGIASLSANVTSTGVQTYTGAVVTNAARTLTATTVNLNNSLSINGSSVGQLTVAGMTAFGAGSSFVTQVAGAGTANYDRLVVSGPVSISTGATLSIASSGGYVWNGTDSFTMIDNDGADPITGTFTGPALTNFLGSALTATQSYSGGTGNDLVFAVPPVNLTINDVTLGEGNSGSKNFTFTVSLSSPAPAGGISFDIATANGTATASGSDYVAKSLTSQVIPAGSASYEFTVLVNGDAVRETNENFFVNVSNASGLGAVVVDGQGLGTISNDDEEADLAITVSDGSVSEVPGTSVTYTIVAINNGPDPVIGATLANTFPAVITGINWTGAGAGGGTVAASGSGNISELINLPVGGSVTLTATGTISASATGSLSNTATVSVPSGISDPTPANNSATDTDTLNPQADLSITKTNGATSVTPGGSTTYTITVSNAGPSNAMGASVTDNLPASLTATWTGEGAGGASGPASGSGNINAGNIDLPAGASFTFTVNADIAASASGNLTNTAMVSAPSGVSDPVPANNSATDIDGLSPKADLAVTKTNGVDSSIAGSTTTYTITVTNAGPSNASVATVVDTLPASITGATWVSSVAGGASATASGSGDLNDSVSVPVGASVTYTITAPISASARGTLVNTASVISSAADPTPSNNTATDTDTVVAQADLGIELKASSDGAPAGGEISYTINLTNHGPSDAVDPLASLPLPPDLAFVSASAPPGWVSTTPAIGSDGTVGFAKSSLGNGDVASFTVVASVKAATSAGTIITTSSSASAGNTDPVTANNEGFATLAVGTLKPSAVQLGTSAGLNRQNGLFELTVDVTNTTPVAINGFRMRVNFSSYLAGYPSLRLYNATSDPGSSDTYVDYPYPVAVNVTVPVKLVFYTSTRTFPNPFTPILSVETLPVSAVSSSDESGVQPRILMMQSGNVLLEFPSVPGRWYRVRYSHDLANWFESPVPIQASNNRMQWIDSGAPLTISPPSSVSSRYYRVNEVTIAPAP